MSELRIERAFLVYVHSRRGDTPNRTIQCIDIFTVPFCDTCLQRQRAEQTGPKPWTPLKRIVSDGQGFAGLIVMAVAFIFVDSAVRRPSVVPLVLACLPFGVGFWLLRSTWQRSRHMSLPKSTSVDLAVDFTPCISLPHEPAWRAFQFRSQSYADKFREVNAARLWQPDSPAAQSAAAERQKDSFRSNLMVGAIVGMILLWLLWKEILSRY